MQQSGKFELPPELVQLEQVGLQQAAALDSARSRRIQAITEASLGSLPSMRSVSGHPGRRFSDGEPSKHFLQSLLLALSCSLYCFCGALGHQCADPADARSRTALGDAEQPCSR